jgi:hypothetical protein
MLEVIPDLLQFLILLLDFLLEFLTELVNVLSLGG